MPDVPSMVEDALKASGASLGVEHKAILARLSQNPNSYARTPEGDWGPYAAALVSAARMETALALHAKALIESAKASEKHAASLTLATWALFAATVLLAFVAVGGMVAAIFAAFIARGGH